LGILVDDIMMGVGFAFFWMTSSVDPFCADFVAQNFIGFMAIMRVFRAIDQLSSIFWSQVMAKKFQVFQECPRRLAGTHIIAYFLIKTRVKKWLLVLASRTQ